MSFSSLTFLLCFLPLTCALYYLFAFAKPIQNLILLIASLVFYAWGAPVFVILLLVSVVLNYLLGLMADAFRVTSGSRGVVITATILVNVSLMLIFKYLSTMQSEIGSFFGVPSLTLGPMIPIGVSFFTFQAISYVVDVLRGTAHVERNPLKVGLYISFFPQIIAGPIVKYEDFAQQLATRRGSLRRFSTGICRFTVGLAKKILIADVLTTVSDHAFALNAQSVLPVAFAWLGALAFALSIYFYFSSYADMAIGLALIFGFRYQENMRYPWAATSVEDFWGRFHLSLGRWCADYVVPLIGQRQQDGPIRLRDLLIVWLLVAVWLGFTPTLLIWSLFNLVLIVIERGLRLQKSKKLAFFRHLYVIIVMVIGFVVFRSQTPTAALHYLASMSGFGGWPGDPVLLSPELALFFLKDNALSWAAALLFATPLAAVINGALARGNKPGIVLDILYPLAIVAWLAICLGFINTGDDLPLRFFGL
jgi:alginate O-acetyltransferase complex protein AlgI